MHCAIVGARERDTLEDRKTVCDLIEAIAAKVPGCLFVTTMTHMGTGMFVKEKCLERNAQNRHRFALVECNVRVFAQHLSKPELAGIYLARNGTVWEMSDALYYLASDDRRGPMEDLLKRFADSGRPVKVLMPGQEIGEVIL